ncbi:LysR family transcriptional regulator [Bacillus nakamurai]|jgi:DNA-binding transcriptional LysR family regulator|nr:LysR family transcriptional regulator [Bacillus nakamurai]MCC9022209.1 LysR family transcriptional regulator [Bacillus nakamurai]MCP6681953.1 LysR family transcriptional regulator [Bacillus nakamurai]MED1226789.1 LysR family transcriptional regulator [Bacillus nakamurai]
MEPHRLDNFIAVAKHRHFTNAAKERMISQPALSRSIINSHQSKTSPPRLK